MMIKGCTSRGSCNATLLRRVLRRRLALARVSVGAEVLRRLLMKEGVCLRRCLEGILTKMFADCQFYHCRLQIPLIWGIGDFADKLRCVTTEATKSPVRMTDFNSKPRIFRVQVISTVADFKFWGSCLVTVLVRLVGLLHRKTHEVQKGSPRDARVRETGPVRSWQHAEEMASLAYQSLLSLEPLKS